MNPMTTMQPVDASELATIDGGVLYFNGHSVIDLHMKHGIDFNVNVTLGAH